jgi:7-carboxy-7-deazaguanine synthase
MLITEKFHSIQGEGTLTGTPMYFVRTNACNLRCKWCDTTYSFQGGREEKLEDLIKECENIKERWICLTGGEPLLQRDALEFVKKVTSTGKKVLIETGGSLSIHQFTEINGTLIDMDIKTPSSGEEKSLNISNLSKLRDFDYAKMVIQDERDFNYAKEFVENHKLNYEYIFQPAWGTDPKWLVDKVLEENIEVRVMLQMHKIVYGDKRGI